MSMMKNTPEEKVLLTTNKPERTICWKRVTKYEQAEVNDLLIEHFATREPLTVSRSLSRDEIVDLVCGLAEGYIDNAASVCAYDMESQKVCGAVLVSGPYNKDAQPEYGQFPNSLKNNQISSLLGKLGSMIPGHANQRLYNVLEMMVIDAKYARQNITTTLINRSLTIAKSNKIPLFYAECTSYNSARLIEKMGWQCVEEIAFADYVDPHTGTKTFATIPNPHTSVKLMVTNLEQQDGI